MKEQKKKVARSERKVAETPALEFCGREVRELGVGVGTMLGACFVDGRGLVLVLAQCFVGVGGEPLLLTKALLRTLIVNF